ncbi:hypothetical protein Tco_0964887 [Tanacetum coccineum]
MWVLLEFSSVKSKEAFRDNVGVSSWFSEIRQASFDINPDGHIVWVEIEGVPLKLWTLNTFKRIVTRWGNLIDTNDSDGNCFHSKRLCLFTKTISNIYENFKIIFRGKVYWIRAKEVPGWTPDLVEDSDEEELSDDDSLEEGMKNLESENDCRIFYVSILSGFSVCEFSSDSETKMEEIDLFSVRRCWGNSTFEHLHSNSGCLVIETVLTSLDFAVYARMIRCDKRNALGLLAHVINHGRRGCDYGGLQEVAVKYQTYRFAKPSERRANIDMRFPKTISEDQSQDLEREVSKQEIKMAVWGCGTDKSPGPDGFSFGFYRHFWPVIEHDVYMAVNHFFIHGEIPPGCNSSFIALIPKVPDANLFIGF